MVTLGTEAPFFQLPDTISNQVLSLDQLRGSTATVIMFLCNHCPYVQHVNPELLRLARDYNHAGISWVAISSNDADAYPEDGPLKMKEYAIRLGYPFPYLYDESQSVAHAYQAACTPDFFVYDHELKLVYRGQLDGSRPGNQIPCDGKDIRQALDCLISGRKIPEPQWPGIGCNIKWKQ